MNETLNQILQTFNIRLVAIPPPKLIQILSNNIDKVPNPQKVGVYEIIVNLPNNEKTFLHWRN